MRIRVGESKDVQTGWPGHRTAAPAATVPVGRVEGEAFPEDLRHWFDGCTLLAWIEGELDKLHWDNPRLQDHLQRHPGYRPRTLLRLLTYAYATQVFGSLDIVRACYSDKFYRLVCEGQPPFPEELSHFRRRNHKLIQEILGQLFVRASQERSGPDSSRPSPEWKARLAECAASRLDTARHLDRVDE